MQVLREVLSAPLATAPFESLAAWQTFSPVLQTAALPLDAAFLGGFHGDRLAPAFAAGYAAALRALVPGLPPDRIVSLCVTEAGGGHPRAIKTTLSPRGEGEWVIRGEKRWATLSHEAGLLLVAASTGEDPASGKKRIRIAFVDPKREGVRLVPMPETPFVPEIRHAEVSLEDVVVSEGILLPGDGWDRYIKPFRTVEDNHVNAAALGYLVRVVRQHGLDRGFAERLSSLYLSMRVLSQEDPTDPAVHIALAGALSTLEAIFREIDAPFAAAAPDEYARFSRDRAIFGIAARARAERTVKAWERLGA